VTQRYDEFLTNVPIIDISALSRPGKPTASNLRTLPPLGLYVHLPWCVRKCPYCDFNSHESAALPEERYLNALESDLEQALPGIWGRAIQTIFIGGGTPSLFSAQSIDRLMASVRARTKLAPNAEVTMEANPGTFEAERFSGFRKAGVNRLSLGVQSFNDDHLKALGRIHCSDQAIAAARHAATLYDTWNIDLMYGLPTQTLAQALEDCARAIELAPPHLSLYNLTLEPNTYFAKYPPKLPNDDLIFDMQEQLEALLVKAGYERYEVSAWSKPGHRCQHNLNYWEFGDYLGIGAGAHSKISNAFEIRREVRIRTPLDFMAGAEAGQAVAQQQAVSPAELPFEFMLNALRLVEGVPAMAFEDRTGLNTLVLSKALAQAQSKGLLFDSALRLQATPTGLRFLNDLQTLFLAE
jgi:putative oxygen-independent coproporphyrinogen III oxidase